jgi:hemerythrin-like domain-containing protein
MKTATENLENDHVNILRLTDVMERMISHKSTNSDHFAKAVEIIKNYADGFHHAKEENLLFPLMAEKGFSLSQGPVAVMISEHIAGRDFVKGITDGTSKFEKGDKSALKDIYLNMQGYIDLLRGHIAKENNILFKMADRILSDGDQEKLLKGFAKVEEAGLCGGGAADCIQKIDELESEYK